MATCILVEEVDGSDHTPVGVFPNVDAALARLVERWMERTDGELNYRTWLTYVEENIYAVSRTPDDGKLDVQFEGGLGSWDLRFTAVTIYDGHGQAV